MEIEVRSEKIYKNGKFIGGNVLKTINRKPFNRGFVGNFVPHWVRYNKEEYLLKGGIDSAYIQGEPVENYIELKENQIEVKIK